MADQLPDNDEAFKLADALLEKPLAWRKSGPAPSDTPVLSFAIFRGFDRAVTQYRSLVELLKSGYWEDALILARSLYELNVNFSAISSSSDPEQQARKFLRFGNFQKLRLRQLSLQDQLRDEKLQPAPSDTAIADCERRIEAIDSMLDRDFAEFRTENGKWQETWSGVSVETLAQRLAKETGGRRGQSDYFVFRLESLFTHNTPGALFLALTQGRETADWTEFQPALEKAGRDGLRQFLHAASLCFVDIVGIAGGCIVGYEREWFEQFALPLLNKF